MIKRDPGYIHPTDYQYVPADPDPDFDPQHNKRVIAETIRKNEALKRKREAESTEKVRERTNAAAMYLKNIQMGGGARSPEAYFGSNHLAYLRGQEIVKTLQSKLAQAKIEVKK